MRKFLITLLSSIIICSLLLSGCSCGGCSGTNTLSFDPLFYGQKGEPQPGYKETAHYKVDYVKSFGSDVKKDPAITDSLIKYDFEGDYVTLLEVIEDLPEETVSDLPYGKVKITTDQRSALKSQNVKIYRLITRLDLTATYNLPQKAQDVRQDFIYTETYFTPAESGFSPIFTVTQSKYSAISISDDKANIHQLTSNNKIKYNKENYVVTTSYDEKSPTTTSYEYQQSTIIDNTQLLWVMRNIKLSTNQQYEISVVSYQYGDFVNLKITNDGAGTATQPIDNGAIKVNDQDYNQESLKIKRYKYSLSDNKTRGVEQYVFLQNGENGNLGKRNVMYRYIEPLFVFGSYASLGALQFTLDSFTFNG